MPDEKKSYALIPPEGDPKVGKMSREDRREEKRMKRDAKRRAS